MNNNWLKYLVGISAILIAGTAAYFSVTGLGVLFSGAAVAVMVMASSLELAKLVSATYLKQRWNEIKGFNKWYLSFAVGILMLITSAGIFGYLSNAFQQQNLALQQVDREILIHTTKIQQNESQIKQLSTQITEFNSNQGKIIDGGKVNSRLLRSIDNRDKQIAKLNDKISLLQQDNAKENDEINKIKTENLGLEKEVGGFRFVAEAFGVELNSVVKFFIILIVIVFDPLAIALVIAFNQLMMNKRKEEGQEIISKPEELKDFIDETTRVHLSENDLKILEEALLKQTEPNDELKRAAEEYKRRGELLAEIMKNDEELGLYNEPFDNPMIKESEILAKMDEELKLQEEEYDDDDDISDWDVTLMDGLEDEEPFFTEEETEKILQEEPTEEEIQENFSTIEPETENIFQNDDYLTDAILEFNQESIEEEFNEFIPEPLVTPENQQTFGLDIKQLNETLEEVNKEIDTKIEETSPIESDEKKKY
jgi:hypothetical protein